MWVFIIFLINSEAVLRGANIFAPGVITLSRNTKEEVSVVSEWSEDVKITKGKKITIEEQKNLIFLGNGKLKMISSEIFHTIRKGVALEVLDPLYKTVSLNQLDDRFFPQNLPSMLVAHILDPQPNERILDLCTAPGK
jgi:methyltransferase NSUN6